MRHTLRTSMVLLAFLATGCSTHKIDLQPIKVQPIQLTLDINVKVQQEEIEEAASKESPVTNNKAPDFKLLDQNEILVTLSEFRGKWVILYFYPKDNSAGCSLEGRDFTVLLPEFVKMNTQVFGISKDSIKSHCDFIAKEGIKVRLLSDPDHQVMSLYGAWVESSIGTLKYGRAIRTTMIIDPTGVIRHYWPEVIAQGHAERVLKKLSELQGHSPTG